MRPTALVPDLSSVASRWPLISPSDRINLAAGSFGHKTNSKNSRERIGSTFGGRQQFKLVSSLLSLSSLPLLLSSSLLSLSLSASSAVAVATTEINLLLQIGAKVKKNRNETKTFFPGPKLFLDSFVFAPKLLDLLFKHSD